MILYPRPFTAVTSLGKSPPPTPSTFTNAFCTEPSNQNHHSIRNYLRCSFQDHHDSHSINSLGIVHQIPLLSRHSSESTFCKHLRTRPSSTLSSLEALTNSLTASSNNNVLSSTLSTPLPLHNSQSRQRLDHGLPHSCRTCLPPRAAPKAPPSSTQSASKANPILSRPQGLQLPQLSLG